MKLLLTLFCIFAALPFAASADPAASGSSRTVVVSATRIETSLEEVASSVSIVEGQEVVDRQLANLGDALRGLPGVDVVQNGSLGGSSAVFLRGANSEHTLVLIDGVEANNPMSPTRAFNFADLNAANIERIEVLRGPQSTLYGSDAMGGVINITTKRGHGAPSVYASAEAGSYDTYTEQAGISGAKDVFDYSLGFQQQNSHGISSANSENGNSEKDGYRNTGFSGRFGWELSPQARINLISRYNDSAAELDNEDGFDDPNRVLRNEQFFTRSEVQTSFLEKRFTQTWGVGFTNQEFQDDNDKDAAHPLDDLRSRYTGRLLKFDLQNNYKITPWATLVFGADTEQERGSSFLISNSMFGLFESDFAERTARTNGYYSQVQLNVNDRFFTTAGIRVDDHSKFGSKVSWRLAPAYVIRSTGTKLSSTIGTGYKAPSLYQLYSSYGNEELKPEKSLGLDAGIQQDLLKDTLAAGVTYFWNDFDDLISFDPNTFISENIARARTQGIETSLSFTPVEGMLWRASYTLTDTEDLDSHSSLLRRPRSKAGLKVDYELSPRSSVNIFVNAVGRRLDNDFSTFPAQRVTLPSYVTVNIAGHYSITESLEIFARIENLFDREYEDVLGFGTRGAAAYAGLKVAL